MDVPAQPSDDQSTRITRTISNVTSFLGSFPSILVALVLVVAWLVGSIFVKGHLGNNTYQLVINTLTSIVTFLMVFIIQNTQNRDGRAMQAKLDAQNEALFVISQHLGIEDDTPLLVRLVGVEDAPERQIRSEHETVREVARERSG